MMKELFVLPLFPANTMCTLHQPQHTYLVSILNLFIGLLKAVHEEWIRIRISVL